MIENAGIGQPFVEAIVAAAIAGEHGLGLDIEFVQQGEQERGFALAVAIAPIPRLIGAGGCIIATRPT